MDLQSGWEFSPIEDLNKQPTSPVDRYFTRRYKKDVKKKKGEDQCILVHSNRLCIVTIAKYHPILREGKTVCKVDFKVDGKTDRLKNRTSGKSKRGAQYLKEGSPLCHVTCSDGSMYTLYAVVRGSLVEANEHLQDHPELLTEKPDTDGYIAIMLTGLNDHKAQTEALLSQESYDALIQKRLAEIATKTEAGGSQDTGIKPKVPSLEADTNSKKQTSVEESSLGENHTEIIKEKLNNAEKRTCDLDTHCSHLENSDHAVNSSDLPATKRAKLEELPDVGPEVT